MLVAGVGLHAVHAHSFICGVAVAAHESIPAGAERGPRQLSGVMLASFPVVPTLGRQVNVCRSGAQIHKQRRILDAVHAAGCILLFLTPYDPDSMPVEFAFRCMKNFLRSNGPILENLSMPAKLRIAARSVGREAARHAFHEAGYI